MLDETAECDEVQIVHTVAEMKQARDAVNFTSGSASKVWLLLAMMYLRLTNITIWIASWHVDWNEKNLLGAGAATGLTDGLTEAGKKRCKEMQQLGMLVDTSHLK